MKNTVIFRADGNAAIGSGHVMRCLSIADAAAKAGWMPVFVTAGGEFADTIAERGIENIILHTSYDDMESEIDHILSLIGGRQPSAVFVDSYYVTASYLHRLCAASGGGGSAGCKVIYVDDILAFPYPCDYLLNYNIYGVDKFLAYEEMYHQEKKDGEKVPSFLLGTSYAPLRAEFQNLPGRVVKRRAGNILISTGGADFAHMTEELVKVVLSMESNQGTKDRGKGLVFHFIIGAMNGDRDKIHALADSHGSIVLHENIASMSRLMMQSDLAISAAGSTLYELCATRTPTIAYILADNQILGARGFEEHGVLWCAGDVRESSPPTLSKTLVGRAVELAGDYEARRSMAERMKAVVDGRGAERIIKAVLRSQTGIEGVLQS